MWLITWLFFPSGRCFQVWRQTCDSGVTGRNTIPKGTRVTYYLKISIMTFWNETCLKCYIVLPTMKTCLIVTILCLQWGTYVIYLSKVFAHQKLFLLYAQPQKFNQASSHCLTAIIGMSLKYSRLRDFVKIRKREGKPYGFGAIWYENISAQGRRGIFITLKWRQVTEWRIGKDKKNLFQLQETHLLALPASPQLSYLSCETHFPTEKTGRYRPSCSGEILHKHFFSTQEKQAGSRNKSPSLSAKRVLCNTTLECNKLIFGSESKAKALPTLILIGCCQAEWFNTQLSPHLHETFPQRNHAVCIIYINCNISNRKEK